MPAYPCASDLYGGGGGHRQLRPSRSCYRSCSAEDERRSHSSHGSAGQLEHGGGRAGDAAVVSWGDALNYCTVARADLIGEEVVLFVTVVGTLHDAEDALIFADPSAGPVFGRRLGEVWPSSFRHGGGGACPEEDLAWEVCLAFDLPVGLEQSEDLIFRYARGYGDVSIWHLLIEPTVEEEALADRPLLQGGCCQRRQPLPCPPEGLSDELVIAGPEDADEQWLQRLRPERRDRCDYDRRDHPSQRTTKREDGFGARARPQPRPALQPPLAPEGPVPPSDAFYAAIEATHPRIVQTMRVRLRCLQACGPGWHAGDGAALGAALEASWDAAIAARALQSLSPAVAGAPRASPLPGGSSAASGGPSRAAASSGSAAVARRDGDVRGDGVRPLAPKHFARLLPVAQRLAQAESEDHAVAAMRFLLAAVEVSWPPVVRALRSVATPKAVYDDCEVVAKHLSSLFVMIRTMSRSVRIERRSNGPLAALCRKLKTSLEEALAAAGRGSGPMRGSG